MMAGHLPKGRVTVFDDDHYYMGGVLADMEDGFRAWQKNRG